MLLIPMIVITVLCGSGSFLLRSKYESSTTILVQHDESLNPLISYAEAMTMASEDRLRTFNEIIYSRTTIQKLIDSLGIGATAKTEDQRQLLVDAVSHNISIDRMGGDSFRITYLDTDPVRAQRAASLLTDLFINTVVSVEGQRNELAAQFYEKKLQDIRQKFEESQKEVLSLLGQHFNAMPTESRMAYTQVENIDRQIHDLDLKIKNNQQQLDILKTFPSAIHTDEGKQALFDLQRQEIPFATDLRALLTKYDEYLRRFTPEYPEVQKLEQQIVDHLMRMQKALEQEIDNEQPQLLDLEQHRSDLVNNIKQSSISEKVDEDKESDYDIYRKLYDEMKVKLEQARTAVDLGNKGAAQFIILDPPLIPSHPSKPNRLMIILGGLGLGIFIGFLSVVIKEMFDTTVRVSRDIEVYQKPVIAFITDGTEKQLR